MNETTLTERLDERGLLADARGPGCYALALEVPPALDATRRAWDVEHDTRPPGDALERLASAARVAYVGASSNVYDRLCDHAGGAVRQPAVCQAFPPERVVDVWPTSDPFDAEYNRALRLARDGWAVWIDGEVLG